MHQLHGPCGDQGRRFPLGIPARIQGRTDQKGDRQLVPEQRNDLLFRPLVKLQVSVIRTCQIDIHIFIVLQIVPAGKRDGQIAELERQKQEMKAQYDNLKVARILELSDSDTRNARQKINRLVRDVDKCIALLKA